MNNSDKDIKNPVDDGVGDGDNDDTNTNTNTNTKSSNDGGVAGTASNNTASTTTNANNNTSNSVLLRRQDYNPPLWLTGETSIRPSGAGGSRHHKPRFTIPVPAAPPQVRARIQKALQVPLAQEKKQIAHLKSKLADQQKRIKAATAKVKQLEQKKERGIQDIRNVRKEEIATSLASLEKQMMEKHSQTEKELEMKWKQDIEEECNKKRREKQEEMKRKLRERDEIETKRKKQKMESLEAESMRQTSKRTEEANTELAELKRNVDELQHKRTEIVWLLKQVIKAEEKQKVTITTAATKGSSSTSTNASSGAGNSGGGGDDDRKIEANTLTSKQA